MVSLPPGSQLGRYQINDQLGRGGIATMFKAHDPPLDRNVAFKVLPSCYTDDQTFVQRFSQEAQAIAKLTDTPNILRISDFGEDKGFTYIVAEMVSGGTPVAGRHSPLHDAAGRSPRPCPLPGHSPPSLDAEDRVNAE
jgi:serine/threonine protein kinase